MELKILCPQWGHEHLHLEAFFEKVAAAGYDGIDTWIPDDRKEQRKFKRLLREHKFDFVAHQHQAKGKSLKAFRNSFRRNLNKAASFEPLLINSHTGRDYFWFDDNCLIIEDAQEFERESSVMVCHETHRGRILSNPTIGQKYLFYIPSMWVTADLSHWVVCSESYFENLM